MISRNITAGDIQTVTGYSRDQLRGLLDLIDPLLGTFPHEPGTSRIFSSHEFLTIVLCCELENAYGMKRKVVTSFAAELGKVLSRPREVAENPRLILTFNPPLASYFEKEEIVQQGLVVPLTEIFKKVDGHLLGNREGPSQYQGELNLGPSLLAPPETVFTNLKTAGGRE